MAVALAMPGLLAVIVVEPFLVPPPVTGTLTEVAFGANDTEDGTVATLVSEELRLTCRPVPGAGLDRVSKRFCVLFP